MDTEKHREHHLSVKDFHFVLKLDLPAYINLSQAESAWDSLKEELDKYREKWEYVLDRINDIEKLLENENKYMYVKDLPREKKDELRKIIGDMEKQDERFVMGIGMHSEPSLMTIKDVEDRIKNRKKEGLKGCIKDFTWHHFMDKLRGSLKNYLIRVEEEGEKDNYIFITVRFTITWEKIPTF
jgi:hypothetical protein